MQVCSFVSSSGCAMNFHWDFLASHGCYGALHTGSQQQPFSSALLLISILLLTAPVHRTMLSQIKEKQGSLIITVEWKWSCDLISQVPWILLWRHHIISGSNRRRMSLHILWVLWNLNIFFYIPEKSTSWFLTTLFQLIQIFSFLPPLHWTQ